MKNLRRTPITLPIPIALLVIVGLSFAIVAGVRWFILWLLAFFPTIGALQIGTLKGLAASLIMALFISIPLTGGAIAMMYFFEKVIRIRK